MPYSEKKAILARRDHSAHLKAAGEVAQVIEALAGKVLLVTAGTQPRPASGSHNLVNLATKP